MNDRSNKQKKPIYKRWWFWLLLIVIIGAVVDNSEETKGDSKAKEKVTVEDDKNKAEEDKAEEDKADNEDEKEEVKKEEKVEKKENELSNLSPYDMLEETKFIANTRVAAKYFIEEYDKQRIKSLRGDSIKSIAVFSEEPVKDKAGKEYPYSFILTGRYEEKKTGALKDFIMTLGYLDDESLDSGRASCLQYINDDNGQYINVIDPEDDALQKIIDSLS